MEFEPIPMVVVATCTLGVLAYIWSKYPPLASRLLALSLAGHLVAAWGNLYLVLNIYGFGDLLMYQRFGSDLALALRNDFADVAWGAVWVFLQQENPLSVFVPAEGSSVASMVVLCGVTNFFLSNSLTAVSFFWAVASFAGKLCLLQAFAEVTPRRFYIPVLVGTMLMPSSIFWSSGIIKEAVALPALGVYLLGVVRMSQGRLEGLAWMALGGLFVGLIKPYILLVAFGATGIYFYTRRSVRHGRLTVQPTAVLAGAVVAIGGIIAIGEIFPQFSLDNIAQQAANQQSAAFNPQGGSTYIIGDPSQRTVLGQLAFAPLALLTGLFRPLVIEASNAQMVLAGLETTGFLVGTAYVAWTQPLRTLWATVIRYPILTFCLSFTVVFGIATGLTSANLGTLSRYRMPLIPFMATTLIVLYLAHRTQAAPSLERTPGVTNA